MGHTLYMENFLRSILAKKLVEKKGVLQVEAALALVFIMGFVIASVDVFKVGYTWVMLTKTVGQAANWASERNADFERLLPGEIAAKAEGLATEYGLKMPVITVQSYQYDSAGAVPTYSDDHVLHTDTLGEPGDTVLVQGRASVGLLIGGFLSSWQNITVKARAIGVVT
jgi:Flp pilus assembly protein TadG